MDNTNRLERKSILELSEKLKLVWTQVDRLSRLDRETLIFKHIN